MNLSSSEPSSDQAALFGPLLDTLDEQIVVIDKQGIIQYVNRSWRQFGVENGIPAGFDWVGTPYLGFCGGGSVREDFLADQACLGIREVLNGDRESFDLEYPCHSPERKRWFMMLISPIRSTHVPLFVISHVNITQRKLLEERIELLSLHDSLTGLANRRYFDRFLSGEWRSNLRKGTALSLIMIDLDHFKEYNDSLGHPAGDQCLAQVGQALLAFCRRPTDLAARYGGEEFALILGNTGMHAAMGLAEGIRRAIHDLNLAFDETRHLSASLGVASVVPRQLESESALIKQAHQALYEAKRAGGNRCVCGGPV